MCYERKRKNQKEKQLKENRSSGSGWTNFLTVGHTKQNIIY